MKKKFSVKSYGVEPFDEPLFELPDELLFELPDEALFELLFVLLDELLFELLDEPLLDEPSLLRPPPELELPDVFCLNAAASASALRLFASAIL